jgi:transcriptional regulator with XRE-family HTH domain
LQRLHDSVIRSSAVTKEEIKAWLKESGFDRDWLGAQLGVSRRTVDNWLSSSIRIPGRKLQAIEQLLSKGRESLDAEPRPLLLNGQPLLLNPGKDRFNLWNKAWKQSDAETLEEWAIRALDGLAEKAFPEPLKGGSTKSERRLK